MSYYNQMIDSNNLKTVLDLPEDLRNKQVQVIVLPVQEQKPKGKRRLGFLPGPPIPDSFFEPLSEEELQEWGL